MRGLQTHFYATREDWLSFFDVWTDLERVVIEPAGMFPLPAPEPSRLDPFRLSQLGHSRTGDSVSDDAWLILWEGEEIHTRRIRLNTGEDRVVIDHGTTPESVTWRPGGLFGANALIKGELTTTGTDVRSRELYDSFRRPLRSVFSYRKGYYLGQQALALYEAGMRLTNSVSRAREYDLRIEQAEQ